MWADLHAANDLLKIDWKMASFIGISVYPTRVPYKQITRHMMAPCLEFNGFIMVRRINAFFIADVMSDVRK